MRPDWIGVLAFLAGCSGLTGWAAWTGIDREAGKQLMVIGAIVGLVAMWLKLATG